MTPLTPDHRLNLLRDIQKAMAEGYKSRFDMPQKNLTWLCDEALKMEHSAAWDYLNNMEGASPVTLKSFEEVVRPVIKWMAENVSPHDTMIVTSDNAQLLEGRFSLPCTDFIKD